jgi:CMP-N-acetylneuraminic acid synthetase
MFEDIVRKRTDGKSKVDRTKEQVSSVVPHQDFLKDLQGHLGNTQESAPLEDTEKSKKPYEKFSSRTKDSTGKTAVPPNQTQKILAMLKEKKNMRTVENLGTSKTDASLEKEK